MFLVQIGCKASAIAPRPYAEKPEKSSPTRLAALPSKSRRSQGKTHVRQALVGDEQAFCMWAWCKLWSCEGETLGYNYQKIGETWCALPGTGAPPWAGAEWHVYELS